MTYRTKPLYEKPDFYGKDNELVYLGSYKGKLHHSSNEPYEYDLWFLVLKNEERRYVLSKSKHFYSVVSFFEEQFASNYDGLKDGINRVYSKGLDLI